MLKGHVTQDVCANAGTGTGVSIPACSPASNFGGTTASLAWGPTGKLRTATNISACDLYGMTIHWDGDRPLFITDSTGALVQLSVETLGGIFYACQSLAYFVVLDRDFSGTQVSAHNSNGDDDPWEYGQLYSHVIGKGAVVESGGWVNGDDLVNGNGVNSIDNLVLAPTREDGYAVRGLTIQGVRSYDSNTEQWTTPDAYKGDVHDPMSQRSYMWNNNNPVAYSDPSGYDPDSTPDWALLKVASQAIKVGEKVFSVVPHAAQRMVERGITTEMVGQTIEKGAKYVNEEAGKTVHALSDVGPLGRAIVVVTTSATDKIVTAIDMGLKKFGKALKKAAREAVKTGPK